MAGFRTISGSGYGSAYVDALIAGGAVWDMSTGPITFEFGYLHDRTGWTANHGNIGPKIGSDGLAYLLEDDFGPNTWTVTSWSDDAATVANALAQAGSVAKVNFDIDLDFSEVNGFRSASDANLVVWKTDLENWPGGAVWSSADSPQESFEANRSQSWLYLNTWDDGAWEVTHPGGMGFTMILNMVGASLGLQQTHLEFPGAGGGAPGPLGLNQVPFTVMTSNWSHQGSGEPSGEWGSLKTFGAFDIAALQKIYGANITTATGSNVYELPTFNAWNGVWGVGRATGWTCIWDAGGNDTITARSAIKKVTIDLRAATLATGDPNAGGFLSKQFDVAGGFTIAKGAVIENAIGGSGNDTLIGNGTINRLTGGSGKDNFVFTATPNKRTNKDTITDYKVKDDTILLENTIFKKLGSKGSEKSPAKLNASFFKIGDKATDKNDYIIYNKKTGVLSYDADGSGSKQAVDFAAIKKNLPLTHSDFAII